MSEFAAAIVVCVPYEGRNLKITGQKVNCAECAEELFLSDATLKDIKSGEHAHLKLSPLCWDCASQNRHKIKEVGSPGEATKEVIKHGHSDFSQESLDKIMRQVRDYFKTGND